jgi:hypothetical protein
MGGLCEIGHRVRPRDGGGVDDGEGDGPRDGEGLRDGEGVDGEGPRDDEGVDGEGPRDDEGVDGEGVDGEGVCPSQGFSSAVHLVHFPSELTIPEYLQFFRSSPSFCDLFSHKSVAAGPSGPLTTISSHPILAFGGMGVLHFCVSPSIIFLGRIFLNSVNNKQNNKT